MPASRKITSNTMRVLRLVAEDRSPKLEFRKKLLVLFANKISLANALGQLQKEGLVQHRWVITNAGQQVLHKLANQEWKEKQDET